MEIAAYLGDRRTQAFDIQVSTDGSSWTNVFSGRSNGMTAGLQSFDFDDVLARYVRIVGHGNSESDWNSLTEVEFGAGEGHDCESSRRWLDSPSARNQPLTRRRVSLPKRET